ncbi:MAG: carboxylesterase family protein [Oscillospiraceae bacterium]|nr:carboxylesterase family protein [Oscillospiraceae bacterium]
MKERKRRKPVLFWILFVLIVLIALALFELGKNSLWGWALLVLLLVFWVRARTQLLSGAGFLPRLLCFLGFLALLGLLFVISGPREKAVPAVSNKKPRMTGVVRVAEGQLTGVYTADEAVEVYAGIPYAKPPLGELRWREPQPPEPWEGVRVCDTFAPMSMQPRNHPVMGSLMDIFGSHRFRLSLTDNWIEPMSEDSLYLNIWKPAGRAEKLPVLVYIHGGSLTTGQPSYSEYNGESLARKGILVVNFGYRLGVFGYYADEALAAESPNGSTGNYGLLDQIQALKWVRENIAVFGGDPDNVTVAGESAGASAVNALCVSPLSEGLFQRAAAASSGITAKTPYHSFRPMERALETGRAIREEFGAADSEALRAVPAEKLVNTRHANDSMTVDGYALTEQPYLSYLRGANHETALLQGFNVHEADLFCMTTRVDAENYVEKLRPLYGDGAEEAARAFPPEPQIPFYHYLIDPGGTAKGSYDACVSAAWFSYSHYNWARLLGKRGVPVYTYWFTKDNRGLGSNHAGELPYFYGNLNKFPRNYDESDRSLEQRIMEYYVNFIKTGDPNGPGLPVWPTGTEAPDRVLELGEEIRVIPDPYLALYPLIDRFMEQP